MGSFIIKGKAKDIKRQVVEHFRATLDNSIEANGILSPITINLSQELDKLIVAEMSR